MTSSDATTSAGSATRGELADAPLRSLRQRVLRSSGWTGIEYAIGQGLRFGGNLLLTYLLVPEAFGLMAVVNVCVQGLEMFSDVGVAPSIIHSHRGTDRVFLDTAWSVQVVRGFALGLVGCLLAWPISMIYDARLLYLVPVASIAAVLRGFNSTKWFTENRRLALGRLTLSKLVSQVIGMGLMIGWAWVWPTVWALVAGNLTVAALQMLASHWVLPGATDRFRFEGAALRELYQFGRWVAISTAMAFGARHIETLLFGRLVGEAGLGVFWIALQMARVGPEFMQRLGQYVGFPALAELHRQDFARLQRRFLHLRAITVLPLNAGMLLLIVAGPSVVKLLYPTAYEGAGWMLAAMATTSLAGMINDGYGNAYLAMGRSLYMMITMASQMTLSLLCCLGGYYYADSVGFIVGLAFVHWFVYPTQVVLASRLGIWQPQLDLPVLAGTGVIGFSFLLLRLG
jgi:O-antigen/teichoic acid export membrane protein